MNYYKIKNILLVLLMASVFVFNGPANAATLTTPVQIKSTVHEGGSFKGQIINNQTYVDIKGLLTCLPIIVNSKAMSFGSHGKTLEIFDNNFIDNPTPIMTFPVGDSYFLYNNQKINLDTKILIVNNRIQIPLKPVATLYKVKVEYNKSTNTVLASK